MTSQIVHEDIERILSAELPWERLGGARVLVTGAAGFLPSYLVETLVGLNDRRPGFGVEVVGLVRNRSRAEDRFAHLLGRSDFDLLAGDASAPLVDGPVDLIIHAASQASPRYYGVDPVGTIAPNVIGTHNLLRLAHERSASLMYFSSGEVYGQVPSEQVPTTESGYGYLDPVDVRSCYGEGKRAGEALCVAWNAQYGVPAYIVRPFHTYGPGMRLDDGRVFADFVADIVRDQDIVMRSDGSARRAFCYVADATEGFLTVLLRGDCAQPYNVGNEDAETSIAELADTLVGLFPEKGLSVVRAERPAGDVYMQSPISRNAPDTSRLRSLGWRPSFDIAEGFTRTIRSFQ